MTEQQNEPEQQPLKDEPREPVSYDWINHVALRQAKKEPLPKVEKEATEK